MVELGRAQVLVERAHDDDKGDDGKAAARAPLALARELKAHRGDDDDDEFAARLTSWWSTPFSWQNPSAVATSTRTPSMRRRTAPAVPEYNALLAMALSRPTASSASVRNARNSSPSRVDAVVNGAITFGCAPSWA